MPRYTATITRQTNMTFTTNIARFITTGLLLGGCFPEPCLEDGLEMDQRYRVTFLEPYDESSVLSAWDPEVQEHWRECEVPLPPMAAFEATVVGERPAFYQGSCEASVIEPHSFDGFDIIEINKSTGGFPWTSYEPLAIWSSLLEENGCRAMWTITLLAPKDGDPFAAPIASERPPLLAHRKLHNYVGENAECAREHNSCYEYWVASIEAVE